MDGPLGLWLWLWLCAFCVLRVPSEGEQNYFFITCRSPSRYYQATCTELALQVVSPRALQRYTGTNRPAIYRVTALFRWCGVVLKRVVYRGQGEMERPVL